MGVRERANDFGLNNNTKCHILIFFLVICSFRASVPQGLVLEIGETVQILEKCEGKIIRICYIYGFLSLKMGV